MAESQIEQIEENISSDGESLSYYGAMVQDVYDALLLTETEIANAGISTLMITNALNRAMREIHERTKTTFTDGTTLATPSYLKITDEKQDGQGKYDQAYYSKRYPIPDVKTYANGTAAIGATSITVDSTQGFLSTGTIFSGSNKIAYTGKDSVTFTGCSGITTAIANDDLITSYGMEIALDQQGNDPTWIVMKPRTEFDIDNDTGRFFLYYNYAVSSIYQLNYPLSYTPNRVRLNYIYGWNEIPYDITRCTVLLAVKELMHVIVRRSHFLGLNSFNPSMVDVDEQWINDTIMRYTNPLAGNTH